MAPSSILKLPRKITTLSPISNLPTELLEMIFEYLENPDKFRLHRVCRRWQCISKVKLSFACYKVKRRKKVDEDIKTSAGLINKSLLRFKSFDCIDLMNFPVRKIATLEEILELPYTPKYLKMNTTYRCAGLDNISVDILLQNIDKEDKLRQKVIDTCREKNINLNYCIGMGLHQRFNFHDLNKKK